jgi:hypothetical protein
VSPFSSSVFLRRPSRRVPHFSRDSTNGADHKPHIPRESFKGADLSSIARPILTPRAFENPREFFKGAGSIPKARTFSLSALIDAHLVPAKTSNSPRFVQGAHIVASCSPHSENTIGNHRDAEGTEIRNPVVTTIAILRFGEPRKFPLCPLCLCGSNGIGPAILQTSQFAPKNRRSICTSPIVG